MKNHEKPWEAILSHETKDKGIIAEGRSVASCRAHEEESPGNSEHHTWQRQAGGNVGENVTENYRQPVCGPAGKGEKAG